MKTNSVFCLLLILLASCKPSDKTDSDDLAADELHEYVEYNNPPAEDFNIKDSDPIAIMLADQVMNAMGGRKQWDETNVIYWNFLGSRTLLWDKANNKVRIDIPDEKTTIALNMDDMTGKVWKQGEAIENADSLFRYLERGKKMWINDSYWLLMPFKLKDSGVTLKYAREDTTMTGERADVLRLTFENVGVTPENAYEVWIDTDSKLVTQWAWFKNADQEQPNFVTPWTDYKDYKGLKLSGDRGERDLMDIRVLKKSPKGAFTSEEPLRF